MCAFTNCKHEVATAKLSTNKKGLISSAKHCNLEESTVNRQSKNGLSSFHASHAPIGLLTLSSRMFLVLAGCLLLPVSSFSSSSREVSAKRASIKPWNSSLLIANPSQMDIGKAAELKFAVPKPAVVRRSVNKDIHRKRSNCSKSLKKNYCMNNGRCRWIHDLQEATCQCQQGWKGERCQNPHIDIDFVIEEKRDHHDVLMIVFVLSGFGWLFLIMTTCVCWRRYKSVHRQLILESSHKENATTTILPQDVALTNSVKV